MKTAVARAQPAAAAARGSNENKPSWPGMEKLLRGEENLHTTSNCCFRINIKRVEVDIPHLLIWRGCCCNKWEFDEIFDGN